MIDPATRGDPESPLRWMSKSLGKLRAGLVGMGHEISESTLGKLLKGRGYRLQANAKVREGKQHPDRDAQFEHINETVKAALAADQPVISIDCKKKELIGDYKNGGREWEPTGQPVEVQGHDFPSGVAKAVPYGVYDLAHNEGYVSVGLSAETAQFSVASIRAWWEHLGRERFPNAKRLTITADCGGGNSPRVHLWKVELQRLADETGLVLELCHFPPGTSKWNKVEHRLFSFISLNWRGRPLTSYEVILDLIASTTTSTGLKVYARLDPTVYTKVKVTKDQIAAVVAPRMELPHHADQPFTMTRSAVVDPRALRPPTMFGSRFEVHSFVDRSHPRYLLALTAWPGLRSIERWTVAVSQDKPFARIHGFFSSGEGCREP